LPAANACGALAMVPALLRSRGGCATVLAWSKTPWMRPEKG